MAEMELIGVPQSSFTWTTRIALAEMGVEYRLVPAPPHSPEVLACNPLGKIPAMRHGEVTLGESRAIIGYAEDVLGGRHFGPAEPRAAAKAEQWASLAQMSFDPVMIRAYVLGYLFPGTPDRSPDRARIEAALPQMQAQIGMLEKAAAEGTIGGEFTLADAYLVPMLFYMGRLPEGRDMLAAAPKLSAYLTGRMERPSVQATIPSPLPGG
ncbi:MAG TPA: glutathione S-transferase family protein [Paracoccaceae bacterium]|nr:glutathione S-transferase family protein [Paracoccaceae bacterium]